MKATRLIALVLFATCVFGWAGATHAAGQYVQVKYPASTAENELQVAVTYRIWIPDGVSKLRGIIVHQHGAGTTASQEGSTAADDLHWQALAKKWDCALLGPSYHVTNEKTDLTPGGSELWFDPRRGSEKTFLKALGELGAKSGHPELATVPWALWGHSGGGIWADVLSTMHPDRVVAIWFRSGTAAMFRTRSEFPQPQIPAAVYAIPSMVNPGVKEKNPKIPEVKGKEQGVWWGNLATFREYRDKGAPIGFAPDPRTGHECGDSRYLAIPFLDACLAMRLPDKGSKGETLKQMDMSKAWLAPVLGDTAQPASEFKGNAKEAVWLPNEAVAKAWMEYVKTGAVGDNTPPPAPFNVKVTAKPDKGTEIVWSAEADFESGIRCFIVLRDGQELAQVPKTPKGQYGRPLFQSMTYHDTPSKPLPKMQFLDASAKPNEKHTYAVVSVNSVGLKSEPSSESAKAAVQGKSPEPAFEGEKTKWHGFDRYDFLMDEKTLAVTPAVKGVKAAKGQRPCIVVVPKTAAPGNPWSWRACYWDHEPQTEVELLKRGFHIVFIEPDGGKEGRDKAWDAWYKHLTEKHGLAKRAAFVGMSKGGVNEYSWGVVNPEKVACIYADNPALWDEDFAKIPALAKHDVPLLHVCGSEDFLVQRYTRLVEDTYHSVGGLITVIIKEGHAHHRHSLQNPKLIADWIEQHTSPSTAGREKPAFVNAKFTKGYYYSLEPSYLYLAEEKSYATARGPGFTECYDRYDSPTTGTFKTGGFSIVVPKTVAPGKPWVFTGDALERDATVEQALLAKGYHLLIVSPLGGGFTQKQWDDAYKLLVENGFSNKPVLIGIGPKAGEAYAWAIANPDKVSCIYARNPLMKSLMAGKQQPIDNLAALAKAGVPVLHDCGALDPWLDSQTRVVEKRYKELGGKITVIVRKGEGHFPLSPKDPKSVVDFIVSVGRKSAPADKAAPQKVAPQQDPAKSAKTSFHKNSPFYFDGTVSRQTLENYLDRAITMGYFLVPGQPEAYQFPYREDDVRMIHNLGAKFIGRAIYRWGEESKLGDPAFLQYAKKMIDRVHSADPEVVFQGCLFEQVTNDVNKLKIPAWVFTDFGLPFEERTFSSAAIIKREGRPAKAGGRGGVPIINNLETRLWFYYLAVSYINIGCEALHLGQVGLIGADDKDLKVYAEFLAKVRSYAKLHARRHLVLLDGHVPSGGMVKNGVSLLDFNSFPMRIKAVPGKPQEAILEVGHLDSLFKRSKGCISPSGWRCDSLPYLVEFDNFGRGPNPNVADPKSMFCWGWDEISWFAQQPQEYRNQWILYAHDWIKRTDPNGHLEMPGIRMISCPNETLRTYFANTKSPNCPVGYSQEETIKTIWIKNAPIPVKGDGPTQPKPTAIPVKGDTPTSLYGGGAASRDDGVKKQAGDSFRWTGSGQITWKIQVDKAGDYEVALNHAAEPGAVGQQVQVSSGESKVGYKLALTKGVMGNKSYEMTPLKGLLRLEAGTQTIALSIPDAPKAMNVLALRSLELIPVGAKAAIEADRQEAKRARASTEWLAKAGYGLMFHWTSQSIGKDGTHKPYAKAVDDFDVKRFAEMVEETGAGYVIFTIGHAQSYCPAPLKAWEKYHPGKTTERDLIAEMADALNAKGIKLMCYLNAASLTRYPKTGEKEFTQIMTDVFTEFGQRYQEKMAGYWIDCCYQAKEKYPGFSFRDFFKTCKVGNPNRILALNSWIYPNVSEWQEYWAGETANPVGSPLKGTTQEHGPGAGLRYQALLIMEPYWVQQKVEMPKPQFTAEKLGDYIARCKANGGAVTINLGIYQDGTVDPRAVDVLKEVRKRVR